MKSFKMVFAPPMHWSWIFFLVDDSALYHANLFRLWVFTLYFALLCNELLFPQSQYTPQHR